MKFVLLLIVLIAALSFAIQKTIGSHMLLADRIQEERANTADIAEVEPRMVVMR